MNKEELKIILENHKYWLSKDCDGWEKMEANLRGADLKHANLRNANLRWADLTDTDLRGADLKYADLTGADLRGSNLRDANLRSADLTDADLKYADLTDAYLTDTDLRGADLKHANLRNANLRCANLRNADLRGTKNIPFIPFVCPDFGSFIGFKKAKGKVVALEIPEDAKRCSATTRKCRCDKAKVLGIYDINHNLLADTEIASDHDKNFLYVVGENVSVDNFDENRWNECSKGIHFFINFEEAARY